MATEALSKDDSLHVLRIASSHLSAKTTLIQIRYGVRVQIDANTVPQLVRHQLRIDAALLTLLPRLRIVVLFGGKAQTVQSWFQSKRPELIVFSAPHPSPLFVNRASANRMKILEVLNAVGSALDPAAPRGVARKS